MSNNEQGLTIMAWATPLLEIVEFPAAPELEG